MNLLLVATACGAFVLGFGLGRGFTHRRSRHVGKVRVRTPAARTRLRVIVGGRVRRAATGG